MASTIIIGREGNQKKRITDKTVSRKHCKVTCNDDKTFTIENLSDNGTLVDGRPIIKTTATLDSVLQLGGSYTSTLRELLQGQERSPQVGTHQGNPPQEVYDISHLKRIWESYSRWITELEENQRKINLIRTGLGIFTMCAMPLIFFLPKEIQGLGYCLTGIGVIGNIYSFFGLKNAAGPQERKRRQEAFEDAWVCPNPQCRRSIPARSFKLLVRNYSNCPHCKVKYVVSRR